MTKTQYLGKFERLKAAAARESLPVKLFFGMEMMADGTLFDRLQSGDVQPLGESRFLLVEFDPLDSSGAGRQRLRGCCWSAIWLFVWRATGTGPRTADRFWRT